MKTKNMEYLSESMSAAVRDVLEAYPMNFEFGLWDLKEAVMERYPPSRNNHGDTVSRRLRESRYGRGWMIICVKPNRALYRKVKFEIKAIQKSGEAK